MPAVDSSQIIVAWWGAGLSTALAVVKVWELWRDRFKVEVSHNFTSNATIGNQVLVRNLTSRAMLLKHWELLHCTGRWPWRAFSRFESAEYDGGDHRVEPHSTLTLQFVEENHFDWGERSLGGRRIYIRLHVAGRAPLLCLLYAP